MATPLEPQATARCGPDIGPGGQAPPISVGVLAGGKSTRLGTDKSLVSLESGGPPLLERVLAATRRLSDDPLVIASDRPHYERFGARVVPDRYPGTGVLGGIATALHAAAHDRCLLVSCDHPFLSEGLLRAMAEIPGAWDVLIPVLPGRSRQGGSLVRQTLHAIYHRRCLPAIEGAIAAGSFQVIGFFSEVRVHELSEEFCRGHDPNLRSFFSVNTIEALEQARGWVRDGGAVAGDS